VFPQYLANQQLYEGQNPDFASFIKQQVSSIELIERFVFAAILSLVDFFVSQANNIKQIAWEQTCESDTA
jgi:hypothetical protein